MSWIGKKKIAFIPVNRPSVDVLQSDWKEQILRRIHCDPVQPGVDKSLHSYINTTSYGRAELEGHVLPVVEIEKQDIPADALAGQYEESLRSQGFDAAALVTLNGEGAGNAQSAGFWTRLVMADGVGMWAMELLHVLTGYRDLYLFAEHLRSFDNMVCNCGTHFSAYTKQKLGWLDPSSIRKHVGRTAEYHLHILGLAQPPPAGMTTAVQVGENENFLMVEARQRVDQFDDDIPSEGVIVYEVHSEERYSSPNVTQPSIQHRTQKVLKPRQRFIPSPGVAISVNSAIENGYSITVELGNTRVEDRSGNAGAPNGLAGMVPTACVLPGLGVYSITYCADVPGRPYWDRYHLIALWRDRFGSHSTDLTRNTSASNHTHEVKNPFAYVDTTRNTEIVLWNALIGAPVADVMANYYIRDDRVGLDNLTFVAGQNGSAFDYRQAVGYYRPADDTHYVFFIGTGGQWPLHELWWTGVSPVQYGGNLSASASPGPTPPADAQGSAFIGSQGTNIVLYRGQDSHIHSLYWKGNDRIGWDNLSGVAGTPLAKRYGFLPVYSPDPVGYYTAHNDTHQVVYRGQDDHLYELYWEGNAPVVGWDITDRTPGAPVARYNVCNFSAYYSAGTNTKHVIYVTEDYHLHDIAWTPGRPDSVRPEHFDLTTLTSPPLPPARGRPATFTVEGPNTQHVAYRGSDNHIYEVIW